MILKTKLKILILIVSLIPLQFISQVSEIEALRGLKKSEKPLGKFDGESVPVYLPDGKRIKGKEMMETVNGGNYTMEQYENEKGEIKAILFKKLSDEEIMKIKELSKKRMLEKQMTSIPAKDFTVKDVKGNVYKLKDLKGKIVVINFWFTKCKPCLIEIPELNKLVDKYSTKEVVFLGITYEEKEILNNFLNKQEFKYNIIPSAKNIISLYNVNGYPTHLIINQDSKITFSATGLSNNIVEEIDYNIERLLN
ncbi:TlpA family protein disulfide reductase [Chryseobacterium kwangjuense]|uniref:TlpA family protein disulfide reductase n=1 Tax=Chryseobacterium kwangjuense TaxID=267125 RepID=A0A135WF25_9FLAO|nr:TlpA disulfide reductase family protein [Chryseobacterium kwangjuense]KXH83513.1 hypothetical protein AU378_14060 [Chryseobacterium kwangjuense]